MLKWVYHTALVHIDAYYTYVLMEVKLQKIFILKGSLHSSESELCGGLANYKYLRHPTILCALGAVPGSLKEPIRAIPLYT